ncbi:MAG: hypothetical protein AAGE90_12435 [Pseudomonadota bacterium]
MKEIKVEVKGLRADLGDLKTVIARIEGKLDRTADATQLWRMVIGTWIAGAVVVALVSRLLAP